MLLYLLNHWIHAAKYANAAGYGMSQSPIISPLSVQNVAANQTIYNENCMHTPGCLQTLGVPGTRSTPSDDQNLMELPRFYKLAKSFFSFRFANHQFHSRNQQDTAQQVVKQRARDENQQGASHQRPQD